MFLYARRIDYAASGAHVFVALIELSENKGRGPFEYVIYKCFLEDSISSGGKWKYVIFRCNCKIRKEAQKFFPYGYGFWDSDRDWKNTTDWLYRVAVGGSYEKYPKGTWVKVRCLCPKKKRKTILRFGNLRQILRIRKKELRAIKEEFLNKYCTPLLCRGKCELPCEIKIWTKEDPLSKEIVVKRKEIHDLELEISNRRIRKEISSGVV